MLTVNDQKTHPLIHPNDHSNEDSGRTRPSHANRRHAKKRLASLTPCESANKPGVARAKGPRPRVPTGSLSLDNTGLKGRSCRAMDKTSAPSSPVAADLTADLLIVGGGLAGACLALAAAKGGLTSILVDRVSFTDQLDTGFDGRSSAIARGSRQVLAGIDLWPLVEAEAAAIGEIRVSDGRPGATLAEAWASSLFLHYDSAALDGTPLGHIVENRVLRKATSARLQTRSEITLCAPATLAELSCETGKVSARLADGRRVSAALAVAADGRFSKLRQTAGITSQTWGLSPSRDCLHGGP